MPFCKSISSGFVIKSICSSVSFEYLFVFLNSFKIFIRSPRLSSASFNWFFIDICSYVSLAGLPPFFFNGGISSWRIDESVYYIISSGVASFFAVLASLSFSKYLTLVEFYSSKFSANKLMVISQSLSCF